MRDGICPKCGSTDVYSGASLPRMSKVGSYWSNVIPITLMGVAALDNYVCTACGYVESFISEAGSLEKIRRKWPRVLDQADFHPCPNCGQPVENGWRVCPYCEHHLL